MSQSTPWHAPLLALFGSLGFAAAWVLLAHALDRQCSWMAVLAALDAALLLRMGRVRRGGARAVWGVATTAIAIALANWGIAAAEFGQSVGMLPWDSALRLGAHHAWTLIGLANGSVDVAWLVAGLVIAAVASR
jgi:hypothetical protein